MIRLLRANLLRTVKSKTFWICAVLYAAYSILLPTLLAADAQDHLSEIPTISLLETGYDILGFPLQGMLLAAISCIIFGADFYNGTFRNKLIVGHTRGQIYASNLITTAIIALTLNVIYYIFFITISLPIYGPITSPAKDVFMLLLIGTLMMLSYSAIITFIIMTSRNALIAIVINFALPIAMVFVSIGILDILNQDPFYTTYTTDEFGEFVETVVANPYMPSKFVLGLTRFISDFSPSLQGLIIANRSEYRWQMALYSLIIIGATTGGGIAIFKKANIK